METGAGKGAEEKEREREITTNTSFTLFRASFAFKVLLVATSN